MSAAKHKLLAFVWKSFPKTRREKARHCEAAPHSDGYCFSLSIWAFRQGTEPVTHSVITTSQLYVVTAARSQVLSGSYLRLTEICPPQSLKNGQLMLKRAELSNGFQGRVFKGNIWFECCSFWTFF